MGNLVPASAFFASTAIRLSDGRQVEETIIQGPPLPPGGYERPSAPLPDGVSLRGVATLSVPSYGWSFGASATSASMIAAYYDRNGYPNIYTGPTNGGVMPLDSSSWPNWTDGNGDTYAQNPLTASRNGLDGRSTRGSIDDYWVEYFSSADDPYITGSWVQHTWGNAIGDYMKTSQSAYGNVDGGTTFYYWTDDPGQLTCDDMVSLEITNDGTYGLKLFYEARGYTVTDCYNQKTDNNSGGFTFAKYMAEIDAGRPVLLNLAGFTVVGIGYDSATNTVYLHDTWDYLVHSMTWGGSYAEMQLSFVSIVNLAGPITPAQILLVDDDDNDPDVRSYYANVLSDLGLTYDFWDTNKSDTEPDTSTLANYEIVIWFTGYNFLDYAGPGSSAETALGSWLDGGGCFLMSSQDYIYNRGLTTFASTYLGVGAITNDVGQAVITGAGGAFGGLGPYTLSYPFSNFSDIILPDSITETAFIGDLGDAAVNKNGGTYHTAFFGFPFEAIAASADRQQVMHAFLDSCAPTNPGVYVVDVFTTDNIDTTSPGDRPQAVSERLKAVSLKTSFRPGDPIRLYIEVNNQYSTPQEAQFRWTVLDPHGTDVPALEWSGTPDDPISAGIEYWYIERTIPTNAVAGTYTFTGQIDFNGSASSDTTTFHVSSQSLTVYVPVVIRAPSTPTFFEGPWEQEPNNTSLQANGPLRSGQDYHGYPNDQKDYFSINPGSGGQIVIDLSNHTGAGVQLQLFYQVADVEHRVAFDRDAPYHIQYTGQPGTYYIYIYTESSYNSSTAYTLRVTYP
jgi:hypothetical protein